MAYALQSVWINSPSIIYPFKIKTCVPVLIYKKIFCQMTMSIKNYTMIANMEVYLPDYYFFIFLFCTGCVKNNAANF